MKSIEQIYQARRDFQARELEKRREKIFQEHPKLEEIERAIRLKNLELSKSTIFGDEEQKKLCEVELYELNQQRERYHRDYPIDAEELKLQYFCERCKDRGYMESDISAKCSCTLKIQESLRMGQAHLTNRIEKENFASFNIALFDDEKKQEVFPGSGVFLTERENMMSIRRHAEEFIRDFDKEETKSLFFYGEVGLGKSFMCSSIAKELVERGKTVLYVTMNELVTMLELYHFNREIFFERYTMEDYFALEHSDLLVLDDLGAELTNSFVKTILFNIINSRMINHKKMVISTNLTPDEVSERYEERVHSRLLGYMNFHRFFGENKRWEL